MPPPGLPARTTIRPSRGARPSQRAGEAPRRIEVSIGHDPAGRRTVSLQDLTWGPGVGWYVQKTIRLDPEQVDALMGSLCCARQSTSVSAASGCPANPPCSAGAGEPAAAGAGYRVEEEDRGDGAKILRLRRVRDL